MSQPLQKGSGDDVGQQSREMQDGQGRGRAGRVPGSACSSLPSHRLKESSLGHSLTPEKLVSLEDNEKQESKKKDVHPFCPK